VLGGVIRCDQNQKKRRDMFERGVGGEGGGGGGGGGGRDIEIFILWLRQLTKTYKISYNCEQWPSALRALLFARDSKTLDQNCCSARTKFGSLQRCCNLAFQLQFLLFCCDFKCSLALRFIVI